MDNDDPGAGQIRIPAGYATLQLAAALRSGSGHPDPQVRERAAVKAGQWQQVMDGMFAGSVDVGSRTPLAGTPAWVTPDVVKGGFATGDFKAGGPLLEHELATLAAAGMAPAHDARGWLNARLLTDDGLASLYALLDSGCYDIQVPEEGALLVVAWLTRHGKAAQAREVLTQIMPWFERLRFYPQPAEQPRRFGETVFVRPVSAVVGALQQRRNEPNPRIKAQREAVRVRLPLYDRAVQLFLETVDGDAPFIDIDADGNWRDPATGKFRTDGGWPCRHYRNDWHARGEMLVQEWDDSAGAREPANSAAELLGYLRVCVTGKAILSGRDVGRIRLILARYASKRGLPGSARLAALRSAQATQVKGMPHHLLAGILAERLRACAQDGGIEDLAPFGHPASAAEMAGMEEEADTPMPAPLLAWLQACRIDTVAALVERGTIGSAEGLAIVLPQLSAAINGASVPDPSLKQLYGALYHAFRRRRSLLLLDLASQVKLDELPWVAAIDAERQHGLAPRTLARRTLEELSRLTLTSFPQSVVPNTLIRELGDLADNAGVELLLGEELAADIFMGSFALKFDKAAFDATAMLGETLYSRYYGIDAAQRDYLHELAAQRLGAAAAPDRKALILLCQQRAGVRCGLGKVTDNAMIIEQQQILTTHNLAALVISLDLDAELRPHYEGMARHCFEWICRDQRPRRAEWHADLRAIKNAAYAWRQMVFFLSMAPAPATEEFIAWAYAHLAPQSPRVRNRIAPAMAGLELAAAGRSLDDPASLAGGARRLLAYAHRPHWMSVL